MKRLLASVGLMALVLGSAAEAETLKLVEVITSPERTEVLKGMIDGFKAQNPGVDVEVVSVPWGQAFETVATMIAGGDIPDVIEMPDTWQALYADKLMPLDDDVAKWDHGATLTQKTIDMAKLANGKMTMIPYGFYLRAMFYNKKLLEQAGVKEPPKTMDEFMAASAAVSKLDGKYGYCLRGGPGGTNGWIMMAAVMNGSNEFFTADGKSRLNEPGSVAGIQFLMDLYQKGYAPKDSVNWGFNEIVAGFYSGTCAFLDQDPDALIAIAERMPADDFAVIPMPVGPAGKAFPTIGFAGWSIFNSTKNPDDSWKLVHAVSGFAQGDPAAHLAGPWRDARLRLHRRVERGAVRPDADPVRRQDDLPGGDVDVRIEILGGLGADDGGGRSGAYPLVSLLRLHPTLPRPRPDLRRCQGIGTSHGKARPAWPHQALRHDRSASGSESCHRGRRIHRACWSIGLRQVHAAADDRGAGADQRGRSAYRRRSGERRRTTDMDIAMVFQSYALYPHMDVARNMGFSMEIRGSGREARESRVAVAARTLGLDKLTDRLPRALSGGQRQRVAMGRAIVREPKAFLFDEPLSNLDAALRVEMRLEIARLHRRLDATMIYVTHDQVEALTLADRIVVLNGGVVQQVGTPLELYETPANRFVAQFIGSPTMNVLSARRDQHGVRLANGVRIELPDVKGEVAELGIRPEHLDIAEPEAGDLIAVADVIEHLGSDTNIYAQIDGVGPVMVRQHGHIALRPGDRLGIAVQPSRVHAFDAQGQTLRR